MLVDIDDVFCRYALDRGYVAKDDLEECRAIQADEARQGRHYYLGQILIRQRVLSCEEFLEIENALDQKLYECAHCKTRYARKDLQPGAPCKGCGKDVAVDGRGRLSVAEILASRDPRDLTISLVSGADPPRPLADPFTTRTSDRRRAEPSARRTSQGRIPAVERGEKPEKEKAERPRQRLNRKALEVDPKDLEGLERYEILEELGRGGMGVVFKARQIDIDRLCALKVIKAGPNVPEVQINRFVQEGKSAARLGHPNIVTVYDCGRFRDTFFVAMELIPGRALASVLTDEGRLPIDRGLEIILDILSAVHYAHEHGVIHRDLKPGNILIEDERGRARLIDFGLAKDHEQSLGLTQEGQILGSPFYLSPEQTRGRSKDVDARSDIFALGVILYEMLTGQRPFSGRSAAEVYGKILHSRPVPPAALEPEIDQELQALLLKALEKDPNERYAGADAFAQAIEQYRRERADRGTSSRRVQKTPRGTKVPRTSARIRSVGGASERTAAEPRPAPPSGAGGRNLLVGLLGCAVVAVVAMAAASRPPSGPVGKLDPSGPKVLPAVTEPTTTEEEEEDGPPAPDPRSPAERDFVSALDFARVNQDDLGAAIERFRDVAGRGGSWGQKALDEVQRLEGLAVAEAARVTSEATTRASRGEVSQALLQLEEARDRLGAAREAARRVSEEHARVLSAAKVRAQEVAREVDGALARSDLDAAVAAVERYRASGVDEIDGLVRAANQRLERARRDQASAKADDEKRARAGLAAGLTELEELVRARRYAAVLERVATLEKHPGLKLVRGAEATLVRRRQEATLARAVFDGASTLGDKGRGQALELDGVRGRLERVENGILSLKLAGGGLIERKVTELDAEVIARLHALRDDGAQGHLARAVFLLLEGRDAAALVAFEAARKAGVDVSTFEEDLARLEGARAGGEPGRTSEHAPAAPSVEAVKDDFAMVNIPAGTFLMGVDTNRIVADRVDEIPGRRVTLEAYRIDRYEVSNRQYAQFLEWLKKNERTKHRYCFPLEPPNKDHTPDLWGDPRVGGEGQPVVGVDWFDAFAFAAWAGKRLPTEAEWERAARSADGRTWPWGNAWDPSRCLWVETLWGRPVRTEADVTRLSEWLQSAPRLTVAVNALAPGKSQDELFNMAGNVSEWVSDWYLEDYYLVAGNRREDTDPKGPTGGSQRVARGGSWADVRAIDLSCTNREAVDPASRGAWLGFRCALDADAPAPRRLR